MLSVLLWFPAMNKVSITIRGRFGGLTNTRAVINSSPCDLGPGHIFEGKLYFTKDIIDDSFVPKNRKPKPVPQPAAKPAPKPAPKGKHVQVFYV